MPIIRYRRHKARRHAFVKELRKKQIEMNLKKLINLAEKHGVSIPEILEDKTIHEDYKKIIERIIKKE